MPKCSLDVPPHIFKEFEEWGKDPSVTGDGEPKPARFLMRMVLMEIAERRIRDRKPPPPPPPSPLVSASGAPLSATPAPLILPAKTAKVRMLRRKR